jgi:uncharacterized protein
MASFAGRRVLLTGASAGIGRALALELAARGARLAISSRRGSLLEQLAEEIEARGGARPVVAAADLCERDAAAHVAAEVGEVDVLVNNAGTSVHGLQWTVADGEAGRELFEANFWSALALVRAVVPSMRERRAGAIVNVTSLSQTAPFPGLGHYCASKAALAISTQALRMELRDSGVQVLEAVLGPVNTAGAAESRLLPGAKQWLTSSGLGDPDTAARRIADAIARGDERLVYPRRLALSYHLPAVARLYARRFARHADADDATVRRGGSMGDEANRAARAQWQERQRERVPAARA